MTTLTLANPFVRMLSILPAASIATLVMLYLMHQLVHTDFVDIIEPEDTEDITAFINEEPGISTTAMKIWKNPSSRNRRQYRPKPRSWTRVVLRSSRQQMDYSRGLNPSLILH